MKFKNIFIVLSLFLIMVTSVLSADTWHNSSYEDRYKVSITFDTITTSINNSIVKLNVSQLQGYLDSMKIYDNATSLEYPWQWYFESSYDTFGTKEYSNDTIIFLGNFTNNTESIVYIYTNPTFLGNFNTTLLDIIWDFEGTNNSFSQLSYNDTDFITGGYSISTQASPSNGSVLNLTNTYGGMVNLQQAISPQFTTAPSEICYWQKSQYLTTRKNQSEYTVRIGYQNESVRNTFDLLGDNNFSAVFGDMYYFNDMIDTTDFTTQGTVTDQGGIVYFDSNSGGCNDIDIPNGIHVDTSKTFIVEFNLSSNNLVSSPTIFQLNNVGNDQVMAMYVDSSSSETFLRNNGAWDSISAYNFPQDQYNLIKVIVEPQNQRYLVYINGILLEGYKSFSSPSYTGDIDTIRFNCGGGGTFVDFYIDYAYIYGYANEENERIYSTIYNENEWEYICNRDIDFSADTYTPEFDLTTGSLTNITDDAIANGSFIVNNYLTDTGDYIFLDRIFVNYETRNYNWLDDPITIIYLPVELTVNNDMVNNTINYNLPNITINYNGTFLYQTTTMTNCTLYSNGVVNQTDSDVNLSNNQQFVFDSFPEDLEQTFVLEINCSNFEASSTTGGYTYKIDRLNPQIDTDFVNNSQYYKIVSSSVTLNVTFSDTNLEGYNITIKQENGTLINNTFVENLTGTSYSNNTEYSANDLNVANYTIELTAWDSHTTKVIADYNWTKYTAQDSNNVTFKGISFANNKFNISTYDYDKIDGWELEKSTDRYLEKYNFSEIGFWFKKYFRSTKQILYLADSEYQGHFIVGKKHWIDHVVKNESSISNFSVTYKSNYDAWQVKFYVEGYEVEFESIGDLNVNDLIYNFEVLACPENWQPYYSSCTIGDNQTLLYNDSNSCGTYDDVPVDNGTVSSCNYCTLQESTALTGCRSDYTQITYYVYDNFETCCNVTGLASDCTLSSNVSNACVDVYEASDLSEITIDAIMEGGINLKEWIPVIIMVLAVLYLLVSPTIIKALIKKIDEIK